MKQFAMELRKMEGATDYHDDDPVLQCAIQQTELQL